MKLVSTYIRNFILSLLLAGVNLLQAQVWTLQQCIDTAQHRNKNLQIGKNTLAISKQKEKEAKANLIPKLTGNADYKYFIELPYQYMPLSTFNPMAPEGQFKEAQFGVPHSINANLQFTMPLYNPQMYGAIQSTKIASELSDLQYQKTDEQIQFEISNLYYNAQILDHQLTFIDSNLVNAERLLQNIQLLYEQLLSKGTDVSKVKLQVAQLTAQKETIRNKLEQVVNALKFAMGIPIEEELQVDSTIVYQNATEYALSATVDIRLLKAKNRLLASELTTLNRSRFLPSLHLIGTYGATGFGYDKQPNDFIKFHSFGFAGIQLSYPLFNGTVTQRKINQKKLELKNGELQADLLSEQSKMQVENAKLQRLVTERTIKTSSDQIKLAQTIYQQTVLQQQQGVSNLTDVLLADNALREAQQTYLNAVIDYLKTDLDLKRQTGNILSAK